MRLTDQTIIDALKEGKCISRKGIGKPLYAKQPNSLNKDYFVLYDRVSHTNIKVHSLMFSDLESSDWEIVENE